MPNEITPRYFKNSMVLPSYLTQWFSIILKNSVQINTFLFYQSRINYPDFIVYRFMLNRPPRYSLRVHSKGTSFRWSCLQAFFDLISIDELFLLKRYSYSKLLFFPSFLLLCHCDERDLPFAIHFKIHDVSYPSLTHVLM